MLLRIPKDNIFNSAPKFFFIMRNKILDFLQQNQIILSLKILTYKQIS